MKKIALIADGHTGSTLPLAKYLVDRGFFVDYYLFCIDSIGDREAIKIQSTKTQKGIHVIEQNHAPEIYEYVNNSQFRLYYISTYRPYKSVILLRNFIALFNWFLIKGIITQINKERYYAVNLIGRYSSEILIPYLVGIKCDRIVTSLHEVCSHFNANFHKPSKLLKLLFKYKKTIIVHSKKSLNDVLKYDKSDKSCIHYINFGLFETYRIIKKDDSCVISEPYILFYGYILPYKGLSVLYDAIDFLSNNKKGLKKFKIVVAGAGTDSVLNKMKDDERFIVLNHFLTNEEIVTLIDNSLFVVCPYISVSQSGITQTVYTFGKPVIASNIGDFPKIVHDGENGLLFNVGDGADLAEKIYEIIEDDELYKLICCNAAKFEQLYEDYSWRVITEQYIDLF